MPAEPITNRAHWSIWNYLSLIGWKFFFDFQQSFCLMKLANQMSRRGLWSVQQTVPNREICSKSTIPKNKIILAGKPSGINSNCKSVSKLAIKKETAAKKPPATDKEKKEIRLGHDQEAPREWLLWELHRVQEQHEQVQPSRQAAARAVWHRLERPEIPTRSWKGEEMCLLTLARNSMPPPRR